METINVAKNQVTQLQIAAESATSSAACIRGFRSGTLYCAGSITATAFDVQVSPDGENFTDLYDVDGSQVTISVVEDAALELPSACFASSYLRFVGDAAEAAAITLHLELAS